MGIGRAWWEAACCRLAHPAPHLVPSAETCTFDFSMKGLTVVTAHWCAANGGTGYECWHYAAKAAVMRTHSDRMNQYTMIEDRVKALIGLKGTKMTAWKWHQ